jgi:REP element-mobilizing transposase RayT
MSREPLHRRSIRLKGYDYTKPGGYFITLCTQYGACLFGDVADGKMVLNQFGKIVENEWLQTTDIRPYVELDEYCIMPDHFHGIIIIHDTVVGATRRVAPTENHSPTERAAQRVAPTENHSPTERAETVFIGGHYRPIQINHHETDQPVARNARCVVMAAQLLRTHEWFRINEYIRMNPVKWNEKRGGAPPPRKTIPQSNGRSGGSPPQW